METTPLVSQPESQGFQLLDPPPVSSWEKERHDEYTEQLQYMMDSGLPLPKGAEEYLKTNYGFRG